MGYGSSSSYVTQPHEWQILYGQSVPSTINSPNWNRLISAVLFIANDGQKKWRDCASAIHSFRESTYRMDEWTKQLLRLKSWAISGNPEQWMEIRRLWWTVFVFKQAICFTCLIYIVCWSNTCFFWNFPLLFSSFNEFDLEVKVHRQFLGKVTLP